MAPHGIVSVAVALGLLALAGVHSPLAAQSVGTAVSIRNAVQQSGATRAAAPKRLSVGDAVLYGATISTGAASRGEFELIDQTRLVINERSALTIDELVVQRDRTFRKVAVNAVTGAFRFISGASPGQSYEIKTAVSTLGIRGTAFDFYVGRDGQTAVMLLDGAVRLCRRQGRCEWLTRRCDVAVADRRERNARKLAPGESRSTIAGVPFATAFPFIADQSRLDRRFRVRGAGNCDSAFAPPPDNEIRQRLERRPLRRASLGGGPPAGPGPDPDPDPDPPDRGDRPSNPGNDKGVGNAGESPGKGDFGGASRGRGDVANKGKGKKNGKGGDG